MTIPDAARPAVPSDFSVVSSRRVFAGRVCAVRIDEVVMPGGETASREVVEHDESVIVVALDSSDGDDAVLLIEQYRHPLRRRLWELPAGLMDIDDEPAVATAARELLEETGFRASDWSVLLDVASSPGFTDETGRIFLARGLTYVGRPPDAEHEEAELRVARVPLADAVAAVFAGRIVNVMAVAGILAVDHLVRTGTTGRPVGDPSLRGSPDAAAVAAAPGLPRAVSVPPGSG